MKILVINCGSSSLKYQLLEMKNETVLASGNCEKIGLEGSFNKHEVGDFEVKTKVDMPTHSEAISFVMKALMEGEKAVIKSVGEIKAVGHRVVHGGEALRKSVIINDRVEKLIDSYSELAPLHNPPNLLGINACQQILPKAVQVAVFDTAFHSTLPEKAYLYGIPYNLYEKYKVRKYGFHGTSHRYVALRAAEMLGKPIEKLKLISCHLGGGASVCAIKNGKSVDTSMGFTPLEGLMMGTRCGDIDPAVVLYLMDKEGLSTDKISHLLNKQSGALGIACLGSSDFRDLEDAMAEGVKKAKLALDMFGYRVAQYIGQYAVAMNGVDAVIFTGGVGQKGPLQRTDICSYLGVLGLELDEEKNKARYGEADIATEKSTVRALMITTNEELMIARDTAALLKS
ncbi:acetate kinase [Microgenomates group bacterium]|nr:acetate kinase [Microgenomates group bacterium]